METGNLAWLCLGIAPGESPALAVRCEAAEFLRHLAGMSFVHLVAIDPAGGTSALRGSRSVWTIDTAAIAGFIREHEHHNIYYVANEVDPSFAGLKPSKSDIVQIRALYADIDPDKSKPRSSERQRIEQLVDGIEPRPTTVIDSGNGYQLLWILDATIDGRAHRDRVEALGKRISHELGGDTVQSVEHLLRLPGTTNHPTPTKAAAGYEASAACVFWQEDQRYLLADLEARWPSAELTEESAGRDSVSLAALPLGVQELIRTGIHPRNRYESRSEAIGSVITALVARYWSVDDIIRVLSDPNYAISEKCLEKSDPAHWLRPQIDKARERLKGERQRQDAVDVSSLVGGTFAAAQRIPGFSLRRMGDLAVKAIAWLIRGLLERDTLAMLFAVPGVGKSFWAIDVACCVATGSDFHGLEVEQGPVIYIAGEGLNGLARRRVAWEIEHQLALADAPLYVSEGPAALTNVSSLIAVCQAVDSVVAAHGVPILVVIDTLARNFGPGDENSTQDMTGFIAAADQIRIKYGATVLLVHHTGHADKSRARGSMALHGAMDAEYKLERDEVGVIRLEAIKMKDAPDPEPMSYRLRSVDIGLLDDEGKAVTSAVLVSTAYEPIAAKGKAGRGRWQTVALEQLNKLQSQHRHTLAEGGYDPSRARVAVRDWRMACLDVEMPRQRWPEVLSSLEKQGLVLVEYGYVRRILSDVSGPSGS